MTDKLTPEQREALKRVDISPMLPGEWVEVAFLAGYRAAQSAQPAPKYIPSDGAMEDGWRDYEAPQAQPAAVGAKLSEEERRRLVDLAAIVSGEAAMAEVERIIAQRIASARAAGMEYGAKVLDEIAEQAERDYEPSKAVEYYRSKATAIRAAIGSINTTNTTEQTWKTSSNANSAVNQPARNPGESSANPAISSSRSKRNEP